MQHSSINATIPIDNQLVLDKVIIILNMAKTISKKISVEASSSKPSGKPLGKPPPEDKTLGIEPEIHFYYIEDGDETKEGE